MISIIVHIFPREKFTVGFINFINKNFNKQEHLFFLYGINKVYKGSELAENCNVKDINEQKIMFLKAIYNSEKIIVHSLFMSKKLLIFLDRKSVV